MRAAAVCLLVVLAGCGPGGEPAASTDGRHDGLWLAEAIDGERVAPERFLLRLRAGKVVGGRDGCNSWAFDETRPPEPNGTRTILSDMMGCARTPRRQAYWAALGNGNATPRITEEGGLRVKVGEHEIVARKMPQ
jgi:hypothetical protein